MLDSAKRVPYHQVHPLKLATDISTAIASLALLAEHHLGLALTVMFAPRAIPPASPAPFNALGKAEPIGVDYSPAAGLTPRTQAPLIFPSCGVGGAL